MRRSIKDRSIINRGYFKRQLIVVTVLYLGMNDENQEQIMFAQTTLNRFKKIHDRDDYDKVGYHNDDEDDDYERNYDEGKL